MLDLDERVRDGLRELVNRAPVDADVWPNVERYVTKHRRQRHAIIGAVAAVALLVGGAMTTVAVRGADSKVVVSNPSPTSPRPDNGALAPYGPTEGSFTITASPTGGLTFKPSALTVKTGIYQVILVDGSSSQHTLYFADPSTRWAPLMVNKPGAPRSTRVFFGHPGTYAFYCAVPGHRAAGMQGVVTVAGPVITLAEATAAAKQGG